MHNPSLNWNISSPMAAYGASAKISSVRRSKTPVVPRSKLYAEQRPMGSKENSPLRMSYGQPVKDQPVSRIMVGGPAAVLGNPIPSYMNHGGSQGLHQMTYGGLGNTSATQISTSHLHGGYGGGSSTGLPGFGHVPTTSTYGNTTHLGSTMNRTTEYSQTAYGGTPNPTISFHNPNHENNDLTSKETALLKKIEELEKENKMLQGLVKRTEKQITDITKMAQEEERKIFSLLIEVINQKSIKIDYADIEANFRPDPSQLDATHNLSRLDNEEVNAEETNHLLMEHLTLAADEHKGDLPYTLLALMRRSVLSDKTNNGAKYKRREQRQRLMSGTHRGTPPVPKQQHAADGKQVGTTKQAERVLVSALESCSADSILSLMARDSTTRSFMIDRLDELLQGALVTELTSLSNQLKVAEASRQETAHKRDQELQEVLLRCEALERQNGLLEAAQKEKDLFASKLRSELERLDADLAKSKALLEKTEQETKAARHEASQLASWKKDAESKLSQTTELKAGADSQIHTLKEQLAQSQREFESKTKSYSDDLSQLKRQLSDQATKSAQEAEQCAQKHSREVEHLKTELSRTQEEVSRTRQAVDRSTQEAIKQKHTLLTDLEHEWQNKLQTAVQDMKDQAAKLTEDHKKEKAELQDKIKYLRESSVRKDVYEAVLKEKDTLAKQVLDGLVAQERQIEQEGFLNIHRSPNGHVKPSGHDMNPNAQLSSKLATSEATNLQLGLKIKGLEEDGRDQAKKLKLYEDEINRQTRLIKELRSSQAERGSEDNEQRLAIEELLSERGQLEARITELLAYCEAQQESNLKGEGLKNAMYRQVEQLQDALKAKDQNLHEVTAELENTKERMNHLQERAALKSVERSRVLEDSSKRGSDHARPSSQQKLNGDSRLFELEERLKFQENQTIAAKNEIMALNEAINSGRQRLELEQSRMESEKMRLQALVDDYRDQATASRRKLSDLQRSTTSKLRLLLSELGLFKQQHKELRSRTTEWTSSLRRWLTKQLKSRLSSLLTAAADSERQNTQSARSALEQERKDLQATVMARFRTEEEFLSQQFARILLSVQGGEGGGTKGGVGAGGASD